MRLFWVYASQLVEERLVYLEAGFEGKTLQEALAAAVEFFDDDVDIYHIEELEAP